MVSSVRSLGLYGVSGYEVKVECDISGGLPAFDVVGLPGRGGERGPEPGTLGGEKQRLWPFRSAGSP